MAQDYSEYLAIHVLNEQQLISYRSLSRALKVHSNLAKQMLWDFHTKQNGKKPGTVHATYLITGTRRPETFSQTNGVHSQDDEDTVMQSSPPIPGSSATRREDEDKDEEEEQIAVRSVTLVKEEHLDKAKAGFESITGIHIYSLQADGLLNIQTLTECNRKVAATYASEDPLEAWKQYGTIQNPNVKRRRRRNGPPPAAVVVTQATKVEEAEIKTKPAASTKQSAAPAAKSSPFARSDSHSRPSSAASAQDTDKSKSTKPAAAKTQNSDIFKSFAKSNLKAKAKKEESQSSVEANQPEDEPMGGFSDEDDEDTNDDAMQEEEPEVSAGMRKSRKEREAELQAMMDQEDEPMDDAAAAEEGVQAAEEENNAIDKPEPKAEEPKETVTVENGRRRGRRRVMKKKTVKDSDGYLVTREEQAWESFSEDEPAPKKAKMASAAQTNKAAAIEKKGAKPGQGNIMSFFAKK